MTKWLESRVPRDDSDPGFDDVFGVRVPSWECHVCGRRRPDDRIRVLEFRYDLLTGERTTRPTTRTTETLTVCVRYCIEGCESGAPAVAEKWTEPLRRSFRNRQSIARVVRG